MAKCSANDPATIRALRYGPGCAVVRQTGKRGQCNSPDLSESGSNQSISNGEALGGTHEFRVFGRAEPAARAGATGSSRTTARRRRCARSSKAKRRTTPICGRRSSRWVGPRPTIPEQYGGLGLGYLELCVIAEELGRAVRAGPVLVVGVSGDRGVAARGQRGTEGTVAAAARSRRGDRYVCDVGRPRPPDAEEPQDDASTGGKSAAPRCRCRR